MSLASLIAKRADLQSAADQLKSSMEQVVGQMNRTNGAIAVLDDLIAEARAEEETAQAAPPQWEPPAASLTLGTGDADDDPQWTSPVAPEMIVAEEPLSPSIVPEMLPIRHDAELDGPTEAVS